MFTILVFGKSEFRSEVNKLNQNSSVPSMTPKQYMPPNIIQ